MKNKLLLRVTKTHCVSVRRLVNITQLLDTLFLRMLWAVTQSPGRSEKESQERMVQSLAQSYSFREEKEAQGLFSGWGLVPHSKSQNYICFALYN